MDGKSRGIVTGVRTSRGAPKLLKDYAVRVHPDQSVMHIIPTDLVPKEVWVSDWGVPEGALPPSTLSPGRRQYREGLLSSAGATGASVRKGSSAVHM